MLRLEQLYLLNLFKVNGTLDETTPPAPSNDYAVSKLAMEYMARLYESRLPIVITRPFNTIGVGQSDSFLIPKIISHTRKRATLIELGNLDVARDFSDVRIVVQLYQRLLDTPAAVGQTFNVCSGKAWTLNEVLAKVREKNSPAVCGTRDSGNASNRQRTVRLSWLLFLMLWP